MSDGNRTVMMLPDYPHWMVNQQRTIAEAKARIDAAHRAEHPARLCMSGPPGSGRATVAVRLAHDLRSQYPGGVFYFDLGDAEAGPLQVLTEFLRQAGEDRRPESLAEARATFTRLVFAGRTLIVLVCAVTAGDVAAWLPSPPFGVVIITTVQPPSPTDRFLDQGVKSLSPEHAVELLSALISAERVDREPDAARNMVELCGRLPLGVELVAGYLNDRPHRRLAECVAALRNGAYQQIADTSPLFVPFGMVLAALPADRAKAYLTLALHGGPDLRTPAAAQLLACSEPAAEDMLAGLARANMLRRLPADRYRFHAFAAWYVRERAKKDLSAPARRAASMALAQWQAREAVGLARSMWPDRPWPATLLSVAEARFANRDSAAHAFDAEYANLLAGVTDAKAAGAYAECVHLALAVRPWCIESGRAEDAVTVMRVAYCVVGELADPPLARHVLRELGTALEAASEYDEAIDTFQEYGRLAESADERASAREWEGIVEGSRGNWARAIELFEQARKLTDDPKHLALLSMHLGRTRAATAIPDEAVKAIDEAADAMAYFETHRDSLNLFQSAAARAAALGVLGRHDEAADDLAAGLAAMDSDPYRLLAKRREALVTLAAHHRAQGDHAGARQLLLRARSLAEGTTLADLTISVELADVHIDLNDSETAEALLTAAADTARTLGDLHEAVATRERITEVRARMQ